MAYEYQCRPELKEVFIKPTYANCTFDEEKLHLGNSTLTEKYNIYFRPYTSDEDIRAYPTKLWGEKLKLNKNRSHSCTIDGHDIRIEMDAVNLFDTEIHCIGSYGFIWRTNWWFDVEKIVDDLLFSLPCKPAGKGDTGSDGHLLLSLEGYTARTGMSIHANILDRDAPSPELPETMRGSYYLRKYFFSEDGPVNNRLIHNAVIK